MLLDQGGNSGLHGVPDWIVHTIRDLSERHSGLERRRENVIVIQFKFKKNNGDEEFNLRNPNELFDVFESTIPCLVVTDVYSSTADTVIGRLKMTTSMIW